MEPLALIVALVSMAWFCIAFSSWKKSRLMDAEGFTRSLLRLIADRAPIKAKMLCQRHASAPLAKGCLALLEAADAPGTLLAAYERAYHDLFGNRRWAKDAERQAQVMRGTHVFLVVLFIVDALVGDGHRLWMAGCVTVIVLAGYGARVFLLMEGLALNQAGKVLLEVRDALYAQKGFLPPEYLPVSLRTPENGDVAS